MSDDTRSPGAEYEATPHPPMVVDGHPSQSGEDWAASHDTPRTWQPALARWLATLNPGRTQHEYEKAIRYFFDTPGVPQELTLISFDLLLAYRGALALRATPHEQRPLRPETPPPRQKLDVPSPAAIEGTEGDGRNFATEDTNTRAVSFLAPATVNVRLTALRQFLVHCATAGTLPHLTADRIRLALRRLTIERRRPYQILAEQEWEQFLLAAQLPRAARVQKQDGIELPGGVPDDPGNATRNTPLPKSRAGLTGERTAERDYALIALALATGLRAIELAALDLGDLTRDWQSGVEEWWLVLPDAKTKGQRGGRTLPLAPTLVETILTYVKSSGRRWDDAKDRDTPLFLSQTRRRALQSRGRYARLSATHIRGIVDRVETQWLALRSSTQEGDVLRGETRRISPHALRHSTAIALLEGSAASGRPPASVEHVRGWLGHFDIRTTQGYLAHLDARRHRRPFALAPGSAPATEHGEGEPTSPSSGHEPSSDPPTPA